MTGGTLMVSRDVKLHSHYKKRLEALGFKDVTLTAADKDGLNFIINDLKPKLVFVGAGFYYCSTPYMMSLLLKNFPELNIAAVSLAPYPADLGMAFITNGVNSYLTVHDGIDDFYKGLDRIREGKKYISHSVQERMELRHTLPKPAQELSERQIEVIKLMSNGFTTLEIGRVLHITKSTVNRHKADIYRSGCMRRFCGCDKGTRSVPATAKMWWSKTPQRAQPDWCFAEPDRRERIQSCYAKCPDLHNIY